MKALTILQPWAWAIAHHTKRVENRTWATAYRGPLAIHAGKGRGRLDDQLNDGAIAPPPGQLVFGAIIAVAELVACVPKAQFVSSQNPVVQAAMLTPFAEGPWCWVLDRVVALEKPIPISGAQLLWDVPPAVMAAIEAQMKGPAF